MRAGIQLLADIAGLRRRIAVLGDMLELGPDELQFHRDLADPLVAAKIDEVICFGERMRSLHEELLHRGVATTYTDSLDDLRSYVRKFGKDDVILAKASRGMKLERAFEETLRKV